MSDNAKRDNRCYFSDLIADARNRIPKTPKITLIGINLAFPQYPSLNSRPLLYQFRDSSLICPFQFSYCSLTYPILL